MYHCQSLAALVYYEQLLAGFEDILRKVADGPWVELKQCTTCGQLWRIDVWDKYQVRFVAKIESELDWASVDTVSLQKELMLASRGGLGDSKCVCMGCDNQVVKNMAICIEHLYETGNRR
jgi:hypothetical protein